MWRSDHFKPQEGQGYILFYVTKSFSRSTYLSGFFIFNIHSEISHPDALITFAMLKNKNKNHVVLQERVELN